MEAEEESRPSAARRLWGVARWLVLGALLALSFVVFMFGLASSFGHTGTTALRPMNVSEGTDKAIWDKFKAISTGGPTKGAPYGFDSPRDKEALKEKIKGNIVDFDRRLTRELIYLAMGDNLFRQCGWNGQPSSQHDRIILKLDHDGSNPADPESSDLTYPEGKNIQSTSTLKRGVGARITEADYIRCSWESNGLPDPPCSPACPPLGTWWRHSRHKITFDPRGIAVFEKYLPEFLTYGTCCVKQVVCAVDYYPMAASACSEESACAPTCCPSAIESDPTINLCPGTDPCGVDYCSDAPECEDKLELSRLNPDWVSCDPECQKVEPRFSREAAAYKIAQLALQLLMTDSAGCEVNIESALKPRECQGAERNEGICRNIPTTIIFPEWAAKMMAQKGVWSKFIELAGQNYPFRIQQSSPTGGVSFDVKLNDQGLHFNY